MSINRVEIKRFAKLIAEEFLKDVEPSNLQSTSQDEIDGFIIPITSDVEDLANDIIAEKIRESFENSPLDPDDEFWSERQR